MFPVLSFASRFFRVAAIYARIRATLPTLFGGTLQVRLHATSTIRRKCLCMLVHPPTGWAEKHGLEPYGIR